MASGLVEVRLSGQHDGMQLRVMFLALVVAGCGISTTASPDRADLQSAAQSTAALEYYRFEWSASYELSEPDETGRDLIEVSGSGVVDVATGNVDASFRYDPSFAESARRVFVDEAILEVESFTRVVDGEVYVRGWNSAFVDLSVPVDYSTWYRVTDEGYRDPFSSGSALPTEVIPVLGGLLEEGDREGTRYTVAVDRDAILDLSSRFPASLVDFQLRIGGGDFVVTGDITDGLLWQVSLEGDDPGAGVQDFSFMMAVEPTEAVAVSAPDPYFGLPEG